MRDDDLNKIFLNALALARHKHPTRGKYISSKLTPCHEDELDIWFGWGCGCRQKVLLTEQRFEEIDRILDEGSYRVGQAIAAEAINYLIESGEVRKNTHNGVRIVSSTAVPKDVVLMHPGLYDVLVQAMYSRHPLILEELFVGGMTREGH